jgi:hypothetical protein
MYAAITVQLLVIVICAANTLYFTRCNKKADKGEMIIEKDERFRYTI